jgi:hypothetical protein
MKEPWIERFWCFVCRVIGHRFIRSWEYKGTHHQCGRCNRIISDTQP